jgi:prepilin peptidase CpaA
MPLPIATSAVIFVAACIALDLRTRRIPNALTGGAMVLGACFNASYLGYRGLASSLMGVTVPMAALLVPFALGGIGGGDVKMMGAIGALLGPRLALSGLAAGMILGGVIMMVHLARLGRLGEKLRATVDIFSAAAATGSLAPLRVSASQPEAITLPYSVPLGLGTLAVIAASGVWR